MLRKLMAFACSDHDSLVNFHTASLIDIVRY